VIAPAASSVRTVHGVLQLLYPLHFGIASSDLIREASTSRGWEFCRRKVLPIAVCMPGVAGRSLPALIRAETARIVVLALSAVLLRR
jgi:hypothetical protein